MTCTISGDSTDICDRSTAVVLITFNSEADIVPCLESLSPTGVDTLIIDNGSVDETVKIVENRFPKVRIVRNAHNLGYAAAVNTGMSATRAECVIVSNADVIFPPDAVGELSAFMGANPHVGVAGPQQVFPDGSWRLSYEWAPGLGQAALKLFGLASLHAALRRWLWPIRIDRAPKEVGYLGGAVLAVRREAYNQVGGFDQDFFFYAEDADFCDRLRQAGWGVRFLPSATVIHVGGASSTKKDPRTPERYLRMLVDAQLLYMRKRRPGWALPLYRRIEYLHARKMALFFRLLSVMQPDHRAGKFLELSRVQRSLAKIWAHGSLRTAQAEPQA